MRDHIACGRIEMNSLDPRRQLRQDARLPIRLPPPGRYRRHR